MKVRSKVWIPIASCLLLGIVFGITTGKLLWYIPSGLIVGIILAISLDKNKV